VVKSTTTMSVELQRKINALMYRKHITTRSLLIIVHPEVLHRLKSEDSALLVELERRHEARFTFRSDPSYHREQISICNAETGEELKL
jgi:ribonuclease G